VKRYPINYFRPTFRDIVVNISIQKTNKFTPVMQNIKNNRGLSNSLNMEQILYIIVMGISVKSIDLTNLLFCIRNNLCIHGGTLSSNNNRYAFNECARGNKDYITIRGCNYGIYVDYDI
jgi:hypothetical protein